jgi:hypothetical protein
VVVEKIEWRWRGDDAAVGVCVRRDEVKRDGKTRKFTGRIDPSLIRGFVKGSSPKIGAKVFIHD